MPTITGDDIRILARSELTEPVLAVLDGQPQIVDADEVDLDAIVYTRTLLVADFGEDITDLEADVLAAGLTAETSPS